jgi:hypothetical protein
MRRTLLLSVIGKRNPANVHIASASGQVRGSPKCTAKPSRLIPRTLQPQLGRHADAGGIYL